MQRVCSPKRPKTKEPRVLCHGGIYIAGDTSRHQPMGAGHMTVLQLHGPIGFRVLQWCHPMLVQAKRTSYCTQMITLYGARKWIQARTGTFPENMKKTDVIALYKSKDKQECSNYRPISLLITLLKLLEKLIYKGCICSWKKQNKYSPVSMVLEPPTHVKML